MVKYQTIFPLVKNMISISYYNFSSTFIFSIMQDKWIKGFKIEKKTKNEGIILSIVIDDVIVYIENLKESTKILRLVS